MSSKSVTSSKSLRSRKSVEIQNSEEVIRICNKAWRGFGGIVSKAGIFENVSLPLDRHLIRSSLVLCYESLNMNVVRLSV